MRFSCHDSILPSGDALSRLAAALPESPVRAMYSSLVGGIVTDPAAAVVPVDDHLVHRGDGVFETCICVDGGIYNLPAHLARLAASARRVGLAEPEPENLTDLCVRVVRASGLRDASLRILLARGPGGMGVHPDESRGPQLYLVVTPFPGLLMDRAPEGVEVIRSRVPRYPPSYTEVKTCNYLPNVLMKQEASRRGASFALAFGPEGVLLEGATENVMVVTPDRRLLAPAADGILHGTTVSRALDLAGRLVEEGALAEVTRELLHESDLLRCAEAMLVGTTLGVVPIARYEGRPLGGPEPVVRRLGQLLGEEIRADSRYRVPVGGPRT